MKKGSKHSKETKRKMSQKRKKKDNPMFGKRHTKEAKIKMSNTRKEGYRKGYIHPMKGESNPMCGKKHTGKTREKMSNIWKQKYKNGYISNKQGSKHSEKTKRKMSENMKGNKHLLGHKHSKESKKKISKAIKGDKNPNWQGGISFIEYPQEFNKELKEMIRKRDNYQCQECYHYQKDLGYKLHVHHIDFNKHNNEPENLISLCRNCHMQTNFNRDDWINYYQEKMEANKYAV